MEWGEEYLAAWNAHDAETLVAQFAPDCRYLDLSVGLSFVGHDDIRKMYVMTHESSPDFLWEYRGGFRDGNHYVVEFTYVATIAGEKHSTNAVSVGTLDDQGRIVENHDYWNPNDFPGVTDRAAAALPSHRI
jgi:hypothetical protein